MKNFLAGKLVNVWLDLSDINNTFPLLRFDLLNKNDERCVLRSQFFDLA